METTRQAVIYARVSSTRQSSEGSGLQSQESRCREYARAKGYEVAAVFTDDVSGGGDFMKRPGMVALLGYLDTHLDQNFVVIFDDLKRYARDTIFHLKLRHEMELRNARRECLNFTFEDSPEGEFMETIFAAHGQLEREQNRRQVCQKMRARLLAGYWTFYPPIGYRYAKAKGGGKIMVRDEPTASVMQEALEGYAAGRFQTQAEVQRFLQDHPDFPKSKLSASGVTLLLEQKLYAGYLEREVWDIPLRKAAHEPLISYKTFCRIQGRLEQGAYAPIKTNIGNDFALRGFVVCADCGNGLSSCYSTGRSAKYPYYLCHKKGCPSHRKSIPRGKIEGDFETFLRTLHPSPVLFDLIKAMFRDVWDQRQAAVENIEAGIERRIAEADEQIAQLVDRIMESGSATVIRAYEGRIKALEDEKLKLSERVAQRARSAKTFAEQFRTALAFLSNPWILWQSGTLEHRRAVLKLTFCERISYSREDGFRTASMDKLSLPFRLLQNSCERNSRMVEGAGFEPA